MEEYKKMDGILCMRVEENLDIVLTIKGGWGNSQLCKGCQGDFFTVRHLTQGTLSYKIQPPWLAQGSTPWGSS